VRNVGRKIKMRIQESYETVKYGSGNSDSWEKMDGKE
jgi:hypothetical protein